MPRMLQQGSKVEPSLRTWTFCLGQTPRSWCLLLVCSSLPPTTQILTEPTTSYAQNCSAQFCLLPETSLPGTRRKQRLRDGT